MTGKGRTGGRNPLAIGHAPLTDKAREKVAARFRCLGEPMRLRILERLFAGPATVGEIVEAVGGTQANVSKHLSVLRSADLVSSEREKGSSRVAYAIADPRLEALCSLVCAGVESRAREEAEALIGTPRTPGRGSAR